MSHPSWVSDFIEGLIECLIRKFETDPNFSPRDIHFVAWRMAINSMIVFGVREADIKAILELQLSRLSARAEEDRFVDLDELLHDIDSVVRGRSRRIIKEIIFDTVYILDIHDVVAETVLKRLFRDWIAVHLLTPCAHMFKAFEANLVQALFLTAAEKQKKLAEKAMAQEALVDKRIKEIKDRIAELKRRK